MPGLAGIKGNNRADGLAKSTPAVNEKAMDPVNILNAIRDVSRDECSDKQLDFTYVT